MIDPGSYYPEGRRSERARKVSPKAKRPDDSGRGFLRGQVYHISDFCQELFSTFFSFP